METSSQTQEEKRKLFNTAVTNWWRDMQPATEQDGQPKRRGELAELRRCNTLEELLFVPRFQVLRRDLYRAGYGYVSSVAAVAGILARIKQTTELTFPVWLAQSKSGGEPRLSELRFRRLIGYKTLEEAFPALIRILPLADNTAPIASLANDIYHWNDQTRQRWTFAYYDALAGSK